MGTTEPIRPATVEQLLDLAHDVARAEQIEFHADLEDRFPSSVTLNSVAKGWIEAALRFHAAHLGQVATGGPGR